MAYRARQGRKGGRPTGKNPSNFPMPASRSLASALSSQSVLVPFTSSSSSTLPSSSFLVVVAGWLPCQFRHIAAAATACCSLTLRAGGRGAALIFLANGNVSTSYERVVIHASINLQRKVRRICPKPVTYSRFCQLIMTCVTRTTPRDGVSSPLQA